MGKNLDETKDYYDGIARGYKMLYHEEQILKISKVEEFIPNFGRFLDLGSGDGVFNKFISSEIELFSLDLSIELLKLNSNNLKVNGSCLNLPFFDNTFDFISSFTVFQDLPDVNVAILEAKRVLKKEGIFILSFLKMSKSSELLCSLVEENFEIVKKIEEIKDYIFVLKNK